MMPTFHPRGPAARQRGVALWPTNLILLSASVLSFALGAPSSSTSLPSTPSAHATLSEQLHSQPIPFLPVHVRPIGVSVPAVVNPLDGYSSEPAPMGIGDFGVGEGGRPYTYNTT